MGVIIDEDGNMELVQGDSFPLFIEGIPTDENYKVYFSIYNSKGKTVGDEVCLESNHLETVELKIPSGLTDNLVVPTGIEGTEEYYYGIKICLEEIGYEETLCVGNSDIGDLNTITVHPKKVEGTK